MIDNSQTVSWINETAPETVSPDHLNWFYWIIIQIKSSVQVLIAIQIGVCISGVILNWLAVGTAKQFRHPTSGTIWMKYLAIWDNLAILHGLVLGISNLLGVDVETYDDVICKGFAYFGPATVIIANAHLVAMSVDRAFNMTYQTLHYPLPWKDINKKVSAAISLLYLILLLPAAVVSKLEEGICKESPNYLHVLVKVYQGLLVTVGSFVTHFAIICVTTAIFIHQMRERRTPKIKLPLSALNYPRQPTLAQATVPEDGEAAAASEGVFAPAGNDSPGSSQTASQVRAVSEANTDCNQSQCCALSSSHTQQGSQTVQVRVDIEELKDDMPDKAASVEAAGNITEHGAQSPSEISDPAFATESVPKADSMTMQESNGDRDCEGSCEQQIAVNVDSSGSQSERKSPDYLTVEVETDYTELGTYAEAADDDITDFTEQTAILHAKQLSTSIDTGQTVQKGGCSCTYPEASRETNEAVSDNLVSDPDKDLDDSVGELKGREHDHRNPRSNSSSHADKEEGTTFPGNFPIEFEEETKVSLKNGKAYFTARESVCDTEDKQEVTYYTGQLETDDSTTKAADCAQKEVVSAQGSKLGDSNENEGAKRGQKGTAESANENETQQGFQGFDCPGKSTDMHAKMLETEVPEMKNANPGSNKEEVRIIRK